MEMTARCCYSCGLLVLKYKCQNEPQALLSLKLQTGFSYLGFVKLEIFLQDNSQPCLSHSEGNNVGENIWCSSVQIPLSPSFSHPVVRCSLTDASTSSSSSSSLSSTTSNTIRQLLYTEEEAQLSNFHFITPCIHDRSLTLSLCESTFVCIVCVCVLCVCVCVLGVYMCL